MLDGIGGTGMLSTMQYVNVRHELPETGIRQEQAQGIRNGYRPAEMHRDYEAPAADMGISQVKVDIDCYPCRREYGFLNNTDFAQKYGQQGKQDVASATSKHTSQGWDMARSGARPGRNAIGEQAKSELRSQIIKWPQWTAKDIPDPVYTVEPSQIKGQMNVGHDRYTITPVDHAAIEIKTGSAETYIAKEGSIRMWTTEGHYDIYA